MIDRVDPTDEFSWVRGSAAAWADAASVTQVAGGSRGQVLAAFGCGVESEVISVEEAGFGAPSVGLIEVAGGWLALELNGWQGARVEVLGPLSASARAGSVFWSVSAASTLTLAESGTVEVVVGDGGLTQRWGARPLMLDPLLKGLDVESDGDPTRWMLAVVARFTGFAVTRDALDSMQFLVTLQPVADQNPQTPFDRDDLLNREALAAGFNDTAVAELALAADSRQLRRFAVWAAQVLGPAAQLEGNPIWSDMLDRALNGYVGPAPAQLVKLAAGYERDMHRYEAADRVSYGEEHLAERRFIATDLLMLAVSRLDPLSAVYRTAASSRTAYREREHQSGTPHDRARESELERDWLAMAAQQLQYRPSPND